MEEQNELTKENLISPIQGAIDYLELIKEKKGLITEPLAKENYSIAFKELNNFINGINELNQLLYSLGDLLEVDYEELNYEENSLNYYINEFNQFLLNDLIPAMENQDYILLSDLINYELEKHLETYKKAFIKLKEYTKSNFEIRSEE